MVRIKLAGFLCFPDSSNKVCAHQRVQKGAYIFVNVALKEPIEGRYYCRLYSVILRGLHKHAKESEHENSYSQVTHI